MSLLGLWLSNFAPVAVCLDYLLAFRLVEFLLVFAVFVALSWFVGPIPDGDLLLKPIMFFCEANRFMAGLNDPTVGVRWISPLPPCMGELVCILAGF